MISDTITKYGESGFASYNYMMSQNYYKTYKTILENARVSIIPESQGGKSSDSLAIMSMVMNKDITSGAEHSHRSSTTTNRRNFSASDRVDAWLD